MIGGDLLRTNTQWLMLHRECYNLACEYSAGLDREEEPMTNQSLEESTNIIPAKRRGATNEEN